MIRFAIVWAVLLLFLPAISACVIIEGGEDIIFIHKSVGHMLIQEGDVRGIFDSFDAPGFDLANIAAEELAGG